MSSDPNGYYKQGSVDLAVETPVTLKKLAKRRNLTGNSERLVIVLVGLPGRGKSFVARKLQSFLTWRGNPCRIFNVGKYRRTAVQRNNELSSASGACDASFFDPNNKAGSALREAVAEYALRDMLKWLVCHDELAPSSHTSLNSMDSANFSELSSTAESEFDSSNSLSGLFRKHTSHSSRRHAERIAIFDATNSTRQRRAWILEECKKETEKTGKAVGVVFVESICDDEELLDENFRFKVENSPDYQSMEPEEAMRDLKTRVTKYESQYETIEDDTQSYIKIFNLSSKLMVNHIYGRMAKTIVPSLMAWNIGSRPVFVCRSGETLQTLVGPDEEFSKSNHSQASSKRQLRGDVLGERGLQFRDALCDFFLDEGIEFMDRQEGVVHPSRMHTGTSISGLVSARERYSRSGKQAGKLPFPALVMCSTMPRAIQTVSWEKTPFPVKDVSNLNPLDCGDYTGLNLEQVREIDPEWYDKLERDPFHTRFPGGESYSDLLNRLESCIIDIEQQLGPVVVASHVSVLQVLISYFRGTPVGSCTSIEVPMHTVMKFVPLRGGGWMETHHELIPDDSSEEDYSPEAEDELPCSAPIWGDHVRHASRASLQSKN